jgi:HlyD family secretion protein
MTRKTKLTLGVLLGAGVAAGSFAAVQFYSDQGALMVQAADVVRQDLTQYVASTGEIKPKKSVNISSNAMGRIVKMPVKEGDHVSEGDLLISLESIQTAADVEAAQAMLGAAQTELDAMESQIKSNEAAVASAKADIARSEADLNRAKINLDRSNAMMKDGLIAREQFDHTKADYDVAVAQVRAVKARLDQAEAQAAQTLKQREGTSLRLAQQRTGLIRAQDQLSKTTITSPLKGIITYLPVNEGEIAIIGVQNQPGTTLMTIADMSVITAEVKVDETDIVNVHIGQEAEIKVDALGDRKLKGHVSDVGNSAVNRSGNTGNTGNTQEAKDFKVVITLDDPPEQLRPGLSCTASIITARTAQVLTIPLQALTIRSFDDPADPLKKKKIEKEGVYVIKDGTVLFRPVKTGITGTTDVEILEGLSEKEKIVTGPYQTLRTMEDNTKVKVEEEEKKT